MKSSELCDNGKLFKHNTQNTDKVESTSNYTLLINSNKAGLFKSSFSWGRQLDCPFIFQEKLI